MQEIRARGFEVYLAVDEFSWSKKTLPKLLRRRIVSISTADQWDTYLFPDEIPVNIAMPDDLARLRQLRRGKRRLSCRGQRCDSQMPQRINARSPALLRTIITSFSAATAGRPRCAGLQSFGESFLLLSLPPFYETVSSTRIRASVDQNLIFPCSSHRSLQTYIYECGLYVRSQAEGRAAARSALFQNVTQDEQTLPQAVRTVCAATSARAALLARPARLLGWAAGHTILLDDLYDALGSLDAMQLCASTPPARSCSLTRRRPKGGHVADAPQRAACQKS